MEWKMAHVAVALCAVLAVATSSTIKTTAKLTSEYRLPQNVVPLEYKITLDPLLPSIENPEYFEGTVTITVEVKQTTGLIILHVNDIGITRQSVTEEDGTQIITSGSRVPGYEFFMISNYEGEFQEGKKYIINIEYRGYHRDDMYGFYRSSYKDENGITRWLATTQFQATHARRAFPCFDEPAMKATFEISVSKRSGLGAISNMNLRTEDDEWYYFEKTPVMSTYLVSFIVSDFTYMQDDGILKVWARRQAIQQANYSVAIGQPTLDAMERFLLGSKYTFPKMDEVAVPDFSAGAMENWGLCTYRERLILYDKSAANAEHKQRIATVIAHEFAHQWFGDLVGPEWWNFLWLNEGFATYFESFATDMVETDWRMKDQFVVRDVQSSMASDALETTHPITQDVDSPNSIRSIFDTITYEKAGSVIRMMEHFVTTEYFRKGLNRYIDARNHNYANEDHLYAAMEIEFLASNPEHYENVKEVMYTWTRQAGHPVVSVVSSGSNLELSQKRFLLGRLPRPRVETIWSIPITYVGQDGDFSNTKTKAWMKETSLTIPRPSGQDKWYLLNVQETGYYRVNYDAANWKLLIDYLNSNDYGNIHPVNRAQLIDDALILARAGELDYETALDVTRYLQRETDYIPWYSALSNLAYLRRRLTGSDNFDNFKTYILRLIHSIYEGLGFEDADEHPHVDKLHRHLILTWACELEHEHCIQTSKDKFSAFRTRSEPVPADLQSVVFCTALRHGTKEDWDHLWDLYLNTQFATQQTLILTALGCTTDQSIIDDFLHKSITENGDIRRQDASSVFAAVYANSAGLELALSFLEREFDAISTFYGTGVSSIISGIATRISTQELIDRLETFVSNTDLGAATAAAERAVESAKDNLFWMEHHAESIGTWLENVLEEITLPPTQSTTASGNSVTVNSFVYIIFIVNIIYTYIKYQH